ncbi:MAG: hypothetical protein Q8N47_02565 [Bryobacterales bacterium]|nr:hypothetical protein [Bryobacterales bacterium]
MPSAKQMLHEKIDQVSEDEAREILDLVQVRQAAKATEPTRETLISRLKGRPGFRVPAEDSAPFSKFEPIKCPGIPASKLLIADRR